MKLSKLLDQYGFLYSEQLGIHLETKNKQELFKWFLASLLFGARISITIAINTYKAFEEHELLTPQAILDAGWDFLVDPIMREGGYVRYDGKTSDELLKVSKTLIKDYDGDLNNLERTAESPQDLERKLQEFYSVGPVTCRIFLRELRGIWAKVDPELGKFVKIAAKKLGYPANLKGLKKYWEVHKVKGYDFRNFEVALLRLTKDKTWD